MPQPPKKHPVRNFIALLLLALLCVGAVELAVARFAAPELYESVTESIAENIVAPVAETCRSAGERISAYIAERKAEREQRRREEEARRQEEEARRQEEERLERLRRERELAATELAIQLASKPAIKEELTVADPAITELVTEDGHEILTGGNVRLMYYNQGDDAWKNELFGSDPIGSYGCGPTALAMLAASMSGEDATPASVAAWASRAGYCAPRSGSYLSIVQGVSEHFGLRCESLGAVDAQTLCERLSGGGVAVALMGPGHFTARGHFILLHGVTLSGEILVADPNSRENSLAVWDPQIIVDELSQSRHDGAPLWLVTS